MTMGKKIKEARKKAGYTQKGLAEKCNLATGTIQQYELNKRQPRLEQLKKIANVLNVSILELLEDYYHEKNSNFIEKYFLDEIPPAFENVSQILSDFKEVNSLQNEYASEKEKWALSEISMSLKKLTPAGQEEAVNRIKELTEIPRYTKIEYIE